MTANNTQQEILKAFQQEIKFPLTAIHDFLKECNIDSITISSIEISIKKIQDEISQIEIPEPIRTVREPRRKKNNPITNWGNSQSSEFIWIETPIYENHTAKEVNQLKDKVENLNRSIRYLEQLLKITKLFAPQDEPQAEISKKGKNNKPKPDTTPINKHSFIDTFIEKSKEVIFNNKKDIATNCNVSKTWISNHFRLEFLTKLFNEMDKEYNQINKSEDKNQLYESYEDQNKNEIFFQNFSYLKKLLEDKKDKAKFDKARNELRKEVSNKT